MWVWMTAQDRKLVAKLCRMASYAGQNPALLSAAISGQHHVPPVAATARPRARMG